MLQRTATPSRAARDFERSAAVIFRPTTPHLHSVAVIRSCTGSRVGPVAQRRVILYFHGGGYLAGGPRTRLAFLTRLS